MCIYLNIYTVHLPLLLFIYSIAYYFILLQFVIYIFILNFIILFSNIHFFIILLLNANLLLSAVYLVIILYPFQISGHRLILCIPTPILSYFLLGVATVTKVVCETCFAMWEVLHSDVMPVPMNRCGKEGLMNFGEKKMTFQITLELWIGMVK